MSDTPGSVVEIVEKLDEPESDEEGEISLGQVIESFGTRSYGPVLLIPSLLGVSPVSAIPTAPTLLALTVIIISSQVLFGRDHFWLPGFLSQRSVSEDELEKAREKLNKPAKWLDQAFTKRLEWLTHPPAQRICSAIVICLALCVPPLELIPLAAAAPFLAIAAFGIAFMLRDGLLLLAALALSAGSFGLLAWMLISGG